MTGHRMTDATLADAAPLARILGDWVRETGWMPLLHSRAEDEAFLVGMIGTHTVRVAWRGAETCGFLGRRGGRVSALYLARGARGLGLGKALLDEVKAVEPEIQLWTFAANPGAIAFYRREGFEVRERTDGSGNEEGLPDLRLAWRRDP